MQVWKTFIVGSALALVIPVVLAAQPGSDTAIGTWKLDMAKSTFGSATPPKGQTRTYTASPNGLHVVIEEEAADGKKTKTDLTVTYDGKPHPASGSPDFDSAASTRIDPYESKADLIRNGKVIGLLRRLVSQDGKTMTINIRIERANGNTETALSVYERQ
jgi:hypothetical protein